jgi:hypothetical protein
MEALSATMALALQTRETLTAWAILESLAVFEASLAVRVGVRDRAKSDFAKQFHSRNRTLFEATGAAVIP